MINHAQISAKIHRTLLSMSGMRQTPNKIMQVMNDLERELEVWRISLPLAWQPGKNGDYVNIGSPQERDRIFYIQFSYYGSLTAIHTIFYYPWVSVICGIDPRKLEHSRQISLSNEVVANAARSIISATRHMHIDAASPQWSVVPRM
jgi:hypothetical protein